MLGRESYGIRLRRQHEKDETEAMMRNGKGLSVVIFLVSYVLAKMLFERYYDLVYQHPQVDLQQPFP